jgi:hypothetical protein
MDFDFNKIKEMGLEYAEKGKNAAKDLAEKGKTQALIVNEQGKLLKAQRQLGALVYSLAKGKEENQPLVDKYIEMIDSIEGEIARLKASLTPAETAEVEFTEAEEPAAEEAPAAPEQPAEEPRKTCPQCGAPVSDDALFCNKCGRRRLQSALPHSSFRSGQQKPENGRCPLWQDTALFLRKKRNLRKNTGKCPDTLAKPQRMRYNL